MAVLCILLSAVCLWDYCTDRIPNRMILWIFLYGIWYRCRDGGGRGLADYLIICIIVCLIFWFFFKIGALGAGDVKLFSVAAGYLSGRTAVRYLMISLLIAAMISLMKIITEHNARERAGYLYSYLTGVLSSGQWSLYLDNLSDARPVGVHMTGPALLGILLHVGGVY